MTDSLREYLDKGIDREHTASVKWDGRERVFGRADVIPLWVADMDFPTVPEVTQALIERASHPIYGYTEYPNESQQAQAHFLARHFNVDVSPEQILYCPSVVDGMVFTLLALTQPDDEVLIQPPVYGPFFSVTEQCGRKLRLNPLIETETGWQMDFSGMERAFKDGVKFMFLCSPHNPVGRVWTREELSRLLDLVNAYGVTLISDEIHSCFTFDAHEHQSIFTFLGADDCVMLTSASKAFNLAGLRQSSIIIKNADMLSKVKSQMDAVHAINPNIFGALAERTAFMKGDGWLSAVVDYIRENRDYAYDFIQRELPQIRLKPLEGTYLMWLDMRGFGLTHEELWRLIIDKAGVGLNDGLFFGKEGDRHFRLNLATQKRNIITALNDMKKALTGVL